MNTTEHRPRDPHKHSSKETFYRACWKRDGQAAWTYGGVRRHEQDASGDMYSLADDMPGDGTILSAKAASASAALPLLVYEEGRSYTTACRGAAPWTYASEAANRIRAVGAALSEGNKRRVREAKTAAVLSMGPLRWSVFGPERRAMALACDAAEVAVKAAARDPETLDALDRLAQSFSSWGREACAERDRAQKAAAMKP